uniref:Large ribosomal subunit protein uL29 n=1 Tax=candidate division WOR-3 bacterium TaxID=2052148 RepID=A0A7V4EDJ1_UNCW3
MKPHEIREMSIEEIERYLKELKDKYFDLRMQKVIGSLKNPMEIRKTKREIARVLTILNEKKRKITSEKSSKK